MNNYISIVDKFHHEYDEFYIYDKEKNKIFFNQDKMDSRYGFKDEQIINYYNVYNDVAKYYDTYNKKIFMYQNYTSAIPFIYNLTQSFKNHNFINYNNYINSWRTGEEYPENISLLLDFEYVNFILDNNPEYISNDLLNWLKDKNDYIENINLQKLVLYIAIYFTWKSLNNVNNISNNIIKERNINEVVSKDEDISREMISFYGTNKYIYTFAGVEMATNFNDDILINFLNKKPLVLPFRSWTLDLRVAWHFAHRTISKDILKKNKINIQNIDNYDTLFNLIFIRKTDKTYHISPVTYGNASWEAESLTNIGKYVCDGYFVKKYNNISYLYIIIKNIEQKKFTRNINKLQFIEFINTLYDKYFGCTCIENDCKNDCTNKLQEVQNTNLLEYIKNVLNYNDTKIFINHNNIYFNLTNEFIEKEFTNKNLLMNFQINKSKKQTKKKSRSRSRYRTRTRTRSRTRSRSKSNSRSNSISNIISNSISRSRSNRTKKSRQISISESI